jgi:pantoate--beta-alanine ligase
MRLIEDLHEWRNFRQSLPPTQSVGFVPTMGVLHQGHESLMAVSRQENDLSVVSIFVNPTQFNQADDFTHYPRTLDADIELLTRASVDICLLPSAKEMYADNYQFQIIENRQSQLMEGQQRPGHFTGVLTVVMKLLQLVKPNRAYFGEKDYQQYQLIHQMVTAFFMDVEIKACPTIRGPSGLAHSSRNQRLTPAQFKLAEQFAEIFHQSDNIEAIHAKLQTLGIDVDYVEEQNNRRFAAVQIGDIRLIDNYPSR